MEQKLDRLQKQTAANTAAAARASAKADTKVSVVNASAAYPVKGPVVAPSDVVVKMPNNRPTICTADDRNCIAITSRLHFDGGGYDYHPNTPATVPQRLDNGVNVRRARIGVIGKFMEDWNYALIYDFGGSSDGFASTASVGGVPVQFLPGGALSGVENAYLSYTGLKPFGGKLAIEGGVMDLPYTLDEATSSNDIVFMERAAAGVTATNIAAGDFRSTAGARWYTDTFWAGAYVTGPATGAIHSASSINPPGTTEQLGVFTRVAGQIVSGKDYSLHIGGDAQWLIHPPHNLIANTQTLILSDRPELRIDPTTLVSTGAIAGVSGAQVYSAEAAATYGPLFFQGEYFWFNVDRNAFAGLPQIRGRLCGGSLRPDRRNPPLQSGLRLIRRHCADKSVLIDRGLGCVGNRGPIQHHRSQRSARVRERRRGRAADHLHAGAELVRQSKRPLHVRLPSRQRCQAGQPDQFRRCGLKVRCVCNANPGGVLVDLCRSRSSSGCSCFRSEGESRAGTCQKCARATIRPRGRSLHWRHRA
jgi:phosphate-selective porin